MRRRDFLLTTVSVPLFAIPARAQVPERIWRVGVLAPAQSNVSRQRQRTIPELAPLGFVEGHNLSVHGFSADGVFDRLPALARDLVAWKPDVILASAPSAIRAARAATSTIPIVMAWSGEDPVAAGLAQSYARPGGNVTGVVMLSPELDGKRIQVLHEAFPERRRIGVLWEQGGRTAPNERAIQAVADRLGLKTVPFYAASDDEGKAYESAFAAIRAAKVEALAFTSNPLIVAHAARVAQLAIEAGLPTTCEWREMTQKGCLIGFGPSDSALRKRVAVYVARILQGIPAGELPIEEPTVFELTVNLKTAKALGLEIPVAILARADEVFE